MVNQVSTTVMIKLFDIFFHQVAFWLTSLPDVNPFSDVHFLTDVHYVEIEDDDRYDFVSSLSKMVGKSFNGST